jgi:NAD(P)-dependent dehydrogenase (short-subunit alcohol dehydrogenase family)
VDAAWQRHGADRVRFGLAREYGGVAYAASRGAVVAMGQVLALDLAASGICVNVLAPGPVDTPLVAAMHSKEERRQWTERVPLAR